MNAVQLLTTDKKPSGIWLCQCKSFHHCEATAESCCRCSYCAQPVEKGKYIHPDCQTKRAAEIEANRIEKAEKLAIWDGWVYLEDYGSNGGYFENLADLRMHAEFDDLVLPEWVFVCEENPFAGASIDEIVCRIEEQGYEDIWGDCDGKDELQAALNAFNELNAGRVSYEVDYKRVVSTKGAS